MQDGCFSPALIDFASGCVSLKTNVRRMDFTRYYSTSIVYSFLRIRLNVLFAVFVGDFYKMSLISLLSRLEHLLGGSLEVQSFGMHDDNFKFGSAPKPATRTTPRTISLHADV